MLLLSSALVIVVVVVVLVVVVVVVVVIGIVIADAIVFVIVVAAAIHWWMLGADAGVEWWTLVVLGLLLAAGIASVVLRQQGIELWPWAEEPEPETEPQAPIIIEPKVDPNLLEPEPASASSSGGPTADSGTAKSSP